MYAVLNRHGLRFTVRAGNHTQAVAEVLRILGKRRLPAYISVVHAIA
jgi:hypothetical protein